MITRFISLSNLTLLVALSLSTVAAYYSIIGLTAIFSGAVIPIIVMGSILEIGKITTTVWLRKYWHRASWVIKCYLVPAVILLAFLTSMGIFGFLSKAHTDQNLVSGDVLAKISIYDQKIETSKGNIDANRKALKQLDEAVDQVMGRSTDEKGADKAVAIRRGQQKERARLLSEIQKEQENIAKLNEERAPIAAEVRKVEAEVGPIKYIAAFIYGDNPDANLLEAAVRWVIVLIVSVFDPLAIALVLAANASKTWDKEEDVKESEEVKETIEKTDEPEEEQEPEPVAEVDESEPEVQPAPEEKIKVKSSALSFLKNPFVNFRGVSLGSQNPKENDKPLFISHPEPQVKTITVEEEPKVEEDVITEVTVDSTKPITEPIDEQEISSELTVEPEVKKEPVEIITDGVTKEPFQLDGDYVAFDGRQMHKNVMAGVRPEYFKMLPDADNIHKVDFGIEFPKMALTGDMFVRVDVLPNRVFKFNGHRWIEVDRSKTDSHTSNHKYIQFLIDKISTGEYDLDLLTDGEKQAVEEYLSGKRA